MTSLKARELAFDLDAEGTTVMELDSVLATMEDRMRQEPGNQTLEDNYNILLEARQELDYWEGTAREHEAQLPPRPAVHQVIWAIDDNRTGVAREQRIEALTPSAATVICKDLEGDGFCKVTDITSPSNPAGTSPIYYKPNSNTYVAQSVEWMQMRMMFEMFMRGSEK